MVLRLAHVELGVRDISAAREFYAGVLGFQIEAQEGKSLYLRGVEEFDRWSLKLTEVGRPGVIHIAFRVSSNDFLAVLEQQHRELGLSPKRLAAGDEPAQGMAFRVSTPDGHIVEFFHDFEEVDVRDPDGRVRLPMRNTHKYHGIPPTRIDHVNLRVGDVASSLRYWRDFLSFSISEYHLGPEGEIFIAWLRRRPVSHEVALGRYSHPAIHHVAYYTPDPMSVFRTADLVADAGLARNIDFGPGRHGVSNAFFIYVRDPSGNRIEFYHGDYQRDLDRPPIGWRWDEYNERGLIWWGQVPPERFRETQAVLADIGMGE